MRCQRIKQRTETPTTAGVHLQDCGRAHASDMVAYLLYVPRGQRALVDEPSHFSAMSTSSTHVDQIPWVNDLAKNFKTVLVVQCCTAITTMRSPSRR